MMIRTWPGRLTAASLVLLAFAPARAADPPGVLWETTSQMVMEGMPMQMPARTSRVCSHKDWKKPPPGGDDSCLTTDFKVVGNKASWTMQCSGQMPMTGTGEMTFHSADAYSGVIRAAAQGMNMTITLTGKKVGTCDNPQ